MTLHCHPDTIAQVDHDDEELTGIGLAIARTLEEKLKDRREVIQNSSDEEEDEWDDEWNGSEIALDEYLIKVEMRNMD